MLIALANDAAQDRDWQTAYNITRQIDDVLPAGANVADQPLGDPRQLHDPRLARRKRRARPHATARRARSRCSTVTPAAAARSRSRPRAIIGRAAPRWRRGDLQEANAYFQRAAAYPELFYGQLALERLGRSVTPPPQALPQYATTAPAHGVLQPPARPGGADAWAAGPLDRAGIVREGAGGIARHRRRSQPRGRAWPAAQPPGPGGVDGPHGADQRIDVLRPPGLSEPSAPVSSNLWSLAHGISRQESSFDPYAVSHAGARGMMQLMTGTAREQAGKMGVGYDGYRLISDPSATT